jgi:hypothetical protein
MFIRWPAGREPCFGRQERDLDETNSKIRFCRPLPTIEETGFLGHPVLQAVTTTNLASRGVPLNDVQNLAGHADPRPARLYDRHQRQFDRNIVEWMSI